MLLDGTTALIAFMGDRVVSASAASVDFAASPHAPRALSQGARTAAQSSFASQSPVVEACTECAEDANEDDVDVS